MNDYALFDISGRIGKITRAGKALKVNIASNRPIKGSDGEWKDNTTWATITVFKETADWIEKSCTPGDYVRARGRIANGSYEKDGETRYTVDLLTDSFDRIMKAPAKTDAEEA